MVGVASGMHTALRRKSKDWLVQNQDNVSKWGDMSICGLFVSELTLWQLDSVCWSSTKRTSSSSHRKLSCSRHDIAEKLLSWNESTITDILNDTFVCRMCEKGSTCIFHWEIQDVKSNFCFMWKTFSGWK